MKPWRGFGFSRSRGIAPSPPLAAGAKIATLGDSVIARGHAATTAAARTTAQNKANSEIMWAMARNPRFHHWIWWDNTATIANDIPTYGVASAVDNLFRGANFGYSGDTALGITRRVQQVINSGAQVCVIAIGTNTDSPNTAAEKQARVDAAITALTNAGIYVVLVTIRPRWSGDRETLTNVLSTVSGSGTVTLVRNGHGLTNTSATTKEVEFVSPGVTIAGITLSGAIFSGSGGWTVNVVDANTITFTSATLANATVTNGGGSFTWHRNVFVDAAGVSNTGNCIMPSSTRHQVHRDFNDWVLAQSGRNKVVVCDLTSALRDPVRSALTGVYLEPYSWAVMDGVHASARGADAAGAVMDAALNSLIASGYAFDTNPANSNLLTNPTMTGTGGVVPSPFTGQVPSNYQFDGGLIANLTGTMAVAANPDSGGQYLQINMTSDGLGTANTFSTLRFTPATANKPSTGFASTDWVQAVFEIEWVSTTAGLCPAWQATLGEGTTISNRGLGQTRSDYNTEPYPEFVGRRWIMTEPLLVGTRVSLNPRLDIAVRRDLAGSAVVRIRRVFLRIVTAPSTQFPWVP